MTGSPIRSRHRRGERGAGTLEYVGVTIVGSLLVLGLLLSPASGKVGDGFSDAICSVIERNGCSVQPGGGETPYEQATSGGYVALGDSYSSGEGAWDYEEGTDFDDRDDLWPFNDDQEARNRCHRSENAYSQVIAGDNDFAGGFSFVACSGATTEDLDVGGERDPRKLAGQLWPIDEVAVAYERFVDQFRHLPTELEALRQDRGRVSDTELFPRMLAMGVAHDEISAADPFLPPELLPRPWAGRAARELTVRCRKLALQVRESGKGTGLFDNYDSFILDITG
ncbi:MAG: PaaX family transcriptional regulator C-terminal domain-containing protein [Actinomycetota bacterium]